MWKLDSHDWHALKNCAAKFTLSVGEVKPLPEAFKFK